MRILIDFNSCNHAFVLSNKIDVESHLGTKKYMLVISNGLIELRLYLLLNGGGGLVFQADIIIVVKGLSKHTLSRYED